MEQRRKACFGSGELAGNVRGPVLGHCLVGSRNIKHSSMFSKYKYRHRFQGALAVLLGQAALLPVGRQCVWGHVGWLGRLQASWRRGLCREKVREGPGFLDLWAPSSPAPGSAGYTLGGLWVISVSKQRMAHNYNTNDVKKNKRKDEHVLNANLFQYDVSHAFVSLNALSSPVREGYEDPHCTTEGAEVQGGKHLPEGAPGSLFPSLPCSPKASDALPCCRARLPCPSSPPLSHHWLWPLLPQPHAGPPPVPLRDRGSPVQALGLHQCRGEGRQLHELRSHRARVPGPPEGAPGLLSLFPAGEGEGECRLHLRHPDRPLRARPAGGPAARLKRLQTRRSAPSTPQQAACGSRVPPLPRAPHEVCTECSKHCVGHSINFVGRF